MLPNSHAGLALRTAWACVLLMLVVTTASAWLRLSASRPACLDWPGCRAGDRPTMGVAAAAPPALTSLTRGVHRVAASTVLLGVVALVVLAVRRRPRDGVAVADALALLALALGLAVLGVVTPGSRAAAVLLGNQLGGLAMLALAWRLLRRLQRAPPAGRPLAVVAGFGATAWMIQAALGALAGAGGLDVAPIAHLATALVALPLAFGVGWWARGRGRGVEGVALMVVAVLQGLLGAAAAAEAAAPVSVLVHNVGAALGLTLLVGLTST